MKINSDTKLTEILTSHEHNLAMLELLALAMVIGRCVKLFAKIAVEDLVNRTNEV